MTPRPPAPALRAPRAAASLFGPAVIVLAALLGTPVVHAQQECELNGQRVSPADGNSTAGKTGLMRCKDRGTGELQREQQVQNGVFMGLVRFYEKGKLAREHTVNAKGNMQGRAREFAPGGQVLRDATYDDGQERGLVRSFYPGGQLRRATFHPDRGTERAMVEFTERGQMSMLRCAEAPVLAPVADDAKLCGFTGGPSNVDLFDARGTLRSKLSYQAGKRVRTQEFYDNGKPSVVDETSGNRRVERSFSSEGVKRRETVWLLVGRSSIRQREQEFSDRGSLVRDQRWNASGEPVSDDSYHLNGQPRSKAVYSGAGSERTVDVTEFYDSGQRAAQGRYLAPGRGRQVPVGTHQRFNEKGELLAESSFDDKGRVTRERSWDENGELQRDDEVFEDGSRKAFTR